jgi:hypothetical protein
LDPGDSQFEERATSPIVPCPELLKNIVYIDPETSEIPLPRKTVTGMNPLPMGPMIGALVNRALPVARPATGSHGNTYARKRSDPAGVM